MADTLLAAKTILFIGAGAMAEAIVRGLTTTGAVQPKQIIVTNRSDREKLHAMHANYGVQIVEDLFARPETITKADIIVLAVKPAGISAVAEQLRPFLQKQTVMLSVAAGISTQLIESFVGREIQVVRAMPNTACAVLESATAVCYGQACTDEARGLAESILSKLGTVSVVEEPLMDVVTGVSGSGPAYFYYMVEAMQKAAEAQGLPGEIARTLILQTLFGSGKMMQETGLPAATLRKQVSSPNGTTMAGLKVLEDADFHNVMGGVIQKASERSREMGLEQQQLQA